MKKLISKFKNLWHKWFGPKVYIPDIDHATEKDYLDFEEELDQKLKDW